jgi:acetyltransferase-like isoleucine patch superfamily enzyme
VIFVGIVSIFNRLWRGLLVLGGMFGSYAFIRSRFYKLLGVSVGEGVWISYFSYIEQPPQATEPMVELQEGSSVGFHNAILVTDNRPRAFGKPAECRKVVVGRNVFLGANVTILPGTRIGEGCVVGAGALVSGEMPPYHVVVGVPARAVRKLPAPEKPALQNADDDL